jgi:AcrR family transcriptional regulator
VPPTRRTQAERREQTTAALLRAAAELVVGQGVHALTLAAVGERAGYSRGIVNHTFGSKQALLETLARTTQSGFVAGVVHEPGLQRLLYLIDGYIAALGRAGVKSHAFLLLWAEAATAPELAEIFRERDEQFRSDLREDIAAGITAGTVRSDLDPQDVAVAVLAQLRGIGIQRLVDPASVDTDRLRHAVTDQWQRTVKADPANRTAP